MKAKTIGLLHSNNKVAWRRHLRRQLEVARAAHAKRDSDANFKRLRKAWNAYAA